MITTHEIKIDEKLILFKVVRKITSKLEKFFEKEENVSMTRNQYNKIREESMKEVIINIVSKDLTETLFSINEGEHKNG